MAYFAVPTSTALGNCPSETVSAVAQFGATTATVDLPVPFLLEFPNYPTTVSQVPVGNVYNVGTVTPVTLLLFDDVLTQVAVCTRNVQVTGKLRQLILTESLQSYFPQM